MGMIQTFKQAWKIPEMRKKLIFTLIMLIVFRFGSNIPVPGVNKTLLKSMFDANNAGLFGLFDMFTGGSFSQFTILSKWTFIFDMIAGRLELFPVLIMFAPSTWKKK